MAKIFVTSIGLVYERKCILLVCSASGGLVSYFIFYAVKNNSLYSNPFHSSFLASKEHVLESQSPRPPIHCLPNFERRERQPFYSDTMSSIILFVNDGVNASVSVLSW